MRNEITRRKRQPKMKLAFEELTIIEPRLLKLWQRVCREHGGGNYCCNAAWYSLIKPQLLPLVGHERPLVGGKLHDPRLGTSYAFDVAYDALYGAMPDCNHAGLCWSLDGIWVFDEDCDECDISGTDFDAAGWRQLDIDAKAEYVTASERVRR